MKQAALVLALCTIASAEAKVIDLICTDTDKSERKLIAPIHIRVDDATRDAWVAGDYVTTNSGFKLRVSDIEVFFAFNYTNKAGEVLMQNTITINRYTGFAEWIQTGRNHNNVSEYRCEVKGNPKF